MKSSRLWAQCLCRGRKGNEPNLERRGLGSSAGADKLFRDKVLLPLGSSFLLPPRRQPLLLMVLVVEGWPSSSSCRAVLWGLRSPAPQKSAALGATWGNRAGALGAAGPGLEAALPIPASEASVLP